MIKNLPAEFLFAQKFILSEDMYRVLFGQNTVGLVPVQSDNQHFIENCIEYEGYRCVVLEKDRHLRNGRYLTGTNLSEAAVKRITNLERPVRIARISSIFDLFWINQKTL